MDAKLKIEIQVKSASEISDTSFLTHSDPLGVLILFTCRCYCISTQAEKSASGSLNNSFAIRMC